MGARTIQPDFYGADATGELYAAGAASSELLLAFLLCFEQCTVHNSPIAAAQILHQAATCAGLAPRGELEGGMGVGDVGVIEGDINTRQLPPVFEPNLQGRIGRSTTECTVVETQATCIPRIFLGAADDDSLGVHAHP